jgi:hypothetical protein
MKQQLFISLSLITLLGCNSKNDLSLNPNDILSIKVIFVENKEQKIIKDIGERKLIDEIINCMNYANKEPVKFIPVYKLVFYTHNGSFDATLNGNAMSIKDGTKYRLKCEIERLIK